MKTVSCIIVDDEKIAREVLNTHISKINNVDLIAECKNAFEAFNFIRNNQLLEGQIPQRQNHGRQL